LSWNEYGLEVAAAEQKADGRAYYHAVAWVHKDSDMAQASMNGDVRPGSYAHGGQNFVPHIGARKFWNVVADGLPHQQQLHGRRRRCERN
jgi:hypothetical protein